MMSGLRSQRHRMVTWVSLKSGVASSGKCIITQAPHRQPAATSERMRSLLLAQKPMRRVTGVSNVFSLAKSRMVPLGLHEPTTNRSEEHTSELQSRLHLVCRLLLEKKNNKCYVIAC